MGEELKRAQAAAPATRTDTPDVRPGKVWADNDRRSAGRTFRVDRIEGSRAVCTILTNSRVAEQDADAHRRLHETEPPWPWDRRGHTTHIALSRFRPTGTGYRLVSAP